MLLTLACCLPLATASQETHASGLPWFEGSYTELLAKARAEEKVVFLDFWADWCGWCKRLDKDTFSDAQVIAAMEDMLCYSVDVESEAGLPIAERFGVVTLPAMLFLNPDGKLRDVISGYLPPEPFRAQVERIGRDEGTLNDLRQRVANAEGDDGSLYELIRRLGDHGGEEARALRAALAERDPEGTTVSSRRMRLDTLIATVQKRYNQGLADAGAPLEAFLAEETNDVILYQGHMILARLYRFQGDAASGDARAELKRKEIGAQRKTWEHSPADMRTPVGNAIAWDLWSQRDELDDETKAFALVVARGAEAAMDDALGGPERASVLETLACCLHMNGELDAAVATMERAIELDPANPAWKERLAELREATAKG